MSHEHEIVLVKAIGLLEQAYKSLEEAMFIDLDNNFISDADKLIRNATIILYGQTESRKDGTGKYCPGRRVL
jgi:hypothetical protein